MSLRCTIKAKQPITEPDFEKTTHSLNWLAQILYQGKKMSSEHNLKEKLIEYLGSDRFQRFCFAMYKNTKLYFWQEKVIEEFSAKLNIPLPTDFQFWQNLLNNLITARPPSIYEVQYEQNHDGFDANILKNQTLNVTTQRILKDFFDNIA